MWSMAIQCPVGEKHNFVTDAMLHGKTDSQCSYCVCTPMSGWFVPLAPKWSEPEACKVQLSFLFVSQYHINLLDDKPVANLQNAKNVLTIIVVFLSQYVVSLLHHIIKFLGYVHMYLRNHTWVIWQIRRRTTQIVSLYQIFLNDWANVYRTYPNRLLALKGVSLAARATCSKWLNTLKPDSPYYS